MNKIDAMLTNTNERKTVKFMLTLLFWTCRHGLTILCRVTRHLPGADVCWATQKTHNRTWNAGTSLIPSWDFTRKLQRVRIILSGFHFYTDIESEPLEQVLVQIFVYEEWRRLIWNKSCYKDLMFNRKKKIKYMVIEERENLIYYEK